MTGFCREKLSLPKAKLTGNQHVRKLSHKIIQVAHGSIVIPSGKLQLILNIYQLLSQLGEVVACQHRTAGTITTSFDEFCNLRALAADWIARGNAV